MQQYYLAVDIGASSGRHILGYMQDGKLQIEEVYRFPNGLSQHNGHLCWDVKTLYRHILEGLKRCAKIGKIPVSMGIDTWAVDFVLLDENDEILGDTVGYRDSRTQNMDEVVYRHISQQALYARTGIQKQMFNSIYQLMAIKEQQPQHLQQAKSFLMIPDYFNYLLTGEKAVEYTNATTTQLVNPQSKNWDWDLIDTLGFPRDIFGEIKAAGNPLGTLRKSVVKEVGFDVMVTLPATHDTGSAVLAVPSEEDALYLSSGTWSLMGTERLQADCSEQSMQNNYTNEGGYEYRYRYLKNIMGLWMLQSVRRELENQFSFPQLGQMAREHASFPSRVDVNDDCFLAPDSMVEQVRSYCDKTKQQVPHEIGQVVAVIYNSLTACYSETVKELEMLTNRTYPCIHIIGGGCQDTYLNELTAQVTGKPVMAGPIEATAIGNILAQMLGTKALPSLQEARKIIRNSFEIQLMEVTK